jgi:dTMP kinase
MNSIAEKLAGKFLVLDGPDGAGKSTQLALLGDYLRSLGLKVCPARDPGGTPIGDRIRAILLDNAHAEMAVECELMLYMASRAQLAGEVIRPALSRGECVLCDRYISSTLAYQGAGGADTAAIRRVADVAVGGLWPDLTILLDLPAEAGLSRVKRAMDRVESRDMAYHRRVRELFLEQAKDAPERFAVIDAQAAPEKVHAEIRRRIEDWAARGGRAE